MGEEAMLSETEGMDVMVGTEFEGDMALNGGMGLGVVVAVGGVEVATVVGVGWGARWRVRIRAAVARMAAAAGWGVPSALRGV